jgi:hypothetical protein
MFEETINKTELSKVAKESKELLVKYSTDYPDAKNVLSRASDVLEKAINQKLTTPHPKGFFPEEFWEEGMLFQLGDLTETNAQFSLLLKGAASIDTVKKSVYEIEKQAEVDEQDFREKT